MKKPLTQRAQRNQPTSGATNVAIIGAGRGGTALMEIFANDPLVRIVGVAELDLKAPGLGLARQLRIPITHDYRQLLAMERVDLIIDVSGDAEVWTFLQDFHRMGVTVIGGASAKFMWELIGARIRATAEIEKTLNKYQSLYRLYVKETGLRDPRRLRAELGGSEFQAGSLPGTHPEKITGQFGHHQGEQGSTEVGHPGSPPSDLQPASPALRQDGIDSRPDELFQVVSAPDPHCHEVFRDGR
jgi:hypothetical protein